MTVHVVIPTLQGIACIQSLSKEDEDIHSMVCLDGTSQALPISNAYHDFVKKGQGVIARDFGHGAWRIDLSAPVELGESWQLGIYLAHWLNDKGLLGSGQFVKGDTVLWASGAVRVNQAVQPVEGIARKVDHSASLFDNYEAEGLNVIVALCDENMAEFSAARNAEAIAQLVLNSVSDLTALEALTSNEGPPQKLPSKIASENPISPSRIRWIAPAFLCLALLGVVAFAMQHGSSGTSVVKLPADKSKPSEELVQVPENEQASKSKLERTLEIKPPMDDVTVNSLELTLAKGTHDCEASSDLSYQVSTPDEAHRFPVVNSQKLCRLMLSAPSQSSVGFAYLLPLNSERFVSLEPIVNGNERAGWEVPLPTRTGTLRSALLLVSEAELEQAARAEIINYVSVGLDSDLVSPKQIQEGLNSKKYDRLFVTGLAIESF